MYGLSAILSLRGLNPSWINRSVPADPQTLRWAPVSSKETKEEFNMRMLAKGLVSLDGLSKDGRGDGFSSRFDSF